MSEHENIRRTRRHADAGARGDMETYGAMMSDDVVFHFPGDHPFAGDYEGREGMFGFLGSVAEATDNTVRFEVLDVMASEERSAALIRATGERAGKHLDFRQVEVRSFDAGGSITDIRIYPDDTAALNEFFS